MEPNHPGEFSPITHTLCPKCGGSVEDSALFCRSCGASQHQVAPIAPSPFDPPPLQPVFKPSGEQPVFKTSGEQPIFKTSGEQPIFKTSGEQPIFKTSGEQPSFWTSGDQPPYVPPVKESFSSTVSAGLQKTAPNVTKKAPPREKISPLPFVLIALGLSLLIGSGVCYLNPELLDPLLSFLGG